MEGAARAVFEAAARRRAAVGGVVTLTMQAEGVAAATRTVPRDVASFTGREAEFRQLLNEVADAMDSVGVVGICAIGGMAGTGKTAFAVHVAHLHVPRFPDGQIFLQLHGHTPGHRPVDPADALASLLQAAGVQPPRASAGGFVT